MACSFEDLYIYIYDTYQGHNVLDKYNSSLS